jgi:hypothetical protein
MTRSIAMTPHSEHRAKPSHAFLGLIVLVSVLVPASSLAMASHQVRAAHHTAFAPVGPKAIHSAPPVSLGHPTPLSPIARRETVRHAVHRTAAIRSAAMLKR